MDKLDCRADVVVRIVEAVDNLNMTVEILGSVVETVTVRTADLDLKCIKTCFNSVKCRRCDN